MEKLNAKALSLACGTLWGAGAFVIGILDMLTAWADPWGKEMAAIYLGYTPTLLGSVIAGIWAFIHAGIAGLLIGWLYNKFAK